MQERYTQGSAISVQVHDIVPHPDEKDQKKYQNRKPENTAKESVNRSTPLYESGEISVQCYNQTANSE